MEPLRDAHGVRRAQFGAIGHSAPGRPDASPRGQVNGRHTIITDEPDLGGTDSGPAPHELLPPALAACIGTMVSLHAQRRDWELGEVVVDVDYDFETTPRRLKVTVKLSGELTAEQVERLARVARTCPVRRAFDAGLAVEERIVAGAASAA